MTTIESAAPGAGRWDGRTTLNATGEELDAELRRALEDPAARMGAVFSLYAYEGLTLPVQTPGQVAPRDPEFTYPGDLTEGWSPAPPPEPYRTAPLPLPFAIPVSESNCPLTPLQAWWDIVRLPADRTEAPTAAVSGDWVQFSSWTDHGWSGDTPGDLGTAQSGGIDVMGSCLDIYTSRKATTARIKAPSTLGAFIPVYGELHDLAHYASATSNVTTFGLRMPFEFISAVSVTTSHFKGAPRFARSERTKVLQALTAQRGYGDLRHFEISVEYSDGWAARRATLRCEAFPYEREDELRQLTMWIAQAVAHHRLSVPYASAADRSTLAHIAERAPDLEVSVRHGSEYVTRYQRVELPAHRPISVAV